MSNQEKLYIKGFNSGYLLAKHEPELLGKVLKNISPKKDFVEGLFSGKEEYELEYSRTQLDELNHLRNNPENGKKGLKENKGCNE